MNRPYRLHFLCTTPQAASWACQLVDTLSGEPIAQEPTERLRKLALANDPHGQAVAWCGSLPIGTQTKAQLDALEQAGQIPTSGGVPTVYYCYCDETDPNRSEVIATNHPVFAQSIGLAWDIQTTLAGLGLTFWTPKGDGL